MTPSESAKRRPTRRAILLAAAAVVAILVIIGHLLGPGDWPARQTAMTLVIAGAFTTMGALVLVGTPGHLVGRLMLAAGGAASMAVLAGSWTSWLPVAWLGQWLWWPPYGLIFLALLVFPDGRLPSPRWRILAAIIGGATALAAVAFAVAAIDDPRTLMTSAAPASTSRAQILVAIGLGAIAVTMLGLFGVLWSLVLRWRRADGDTRAQLACLLASGIVLVLGLVLDLLDQSGGWILMVVALPAGMTIAVLRYRLYGLDQVINRTIVWLVMTLLVIVGFVGLVAVLRDLLMPGGTSNASLVATGLIAVTFEPVRHRVQRGVNRLLYGERDDPYKVIARLGDLLGRTVEPSAVLPLLTDTIARSLRVPHVAVEVEGRDGPRVVAAHGTASTAVESFDMVTRGERVGRLLVATRNPGTRFTSVERRLLNDLALQAAVAADATRLIRDLQDSRERLITAREEERRRLRRDLHDGLGPTLAGMSMQVRAAQKLLTGQSRAGTILDALSVDLQTCTAEVRQLVDQLRPPALDRGLAAALRTECARFDNPALSVRLRVEGTLNGLPAAIEVAAYRIVAEALTNVVRHAQASTCHVVVHRDRSLRLEIVDDGVGFRTRRPGGVGLDSMRERATELGGNFEIAGVEPRGTSIQVRLPFQPCTTDPAAVAGGAAPESAAQQAAITKAAGPQSAAPGTPADPGAVGPESVTPGTRPSAVRVPNTRATGVDPTEPGGADSPTGRTRAGDASASD